MNKYRSPDWTEETLRLQEVVPEREVRSSQPAGPWPPGETESGPRANPEEDSVVALTWPQETGWRYH